LDEAGIHALHELPSPAGGLIRLAADVTLNELQ
jgi:hypothetical protein